MALLMLLVGLSVGCQEPSMRGVAKRAEKTKKYKDWLTPVPAAKPASKAAKAGGKVARDGLDVIPGSGLFGQEVPRAARRGARGADTAC